MDIRDEKSLREIGKRLVKRTQKTFSPEKLAKIKEQQRLAALAEGHARGYFNKQVKMRTPMVFELYNCRENIVARIGAYRRYDVNLLKGRKKPDKIKKIEMKYCYKFKDQNRVKIAIAFELPGQWYYYSVTTRKNSILSNKLMKENNDEIHVNNE